MSIVNNVTLESNKYFKVNFEGGDLSSDGGLLLIKELVHKICFDTVVKKIFKTTDPGHCRIHTDYENLMQSIYQIIGAHYTDDRADSLRNDPVFGACLGKESLASQPTLSRFFNRLDEKTIEQLNRVYRIMRKIISDIDGKPEQLIFDIDSTLFNTYGKQEGSAFNYHYQDNGLHPLLCFDGITHDLLKAEIRSGTHYCSKGAADFMRPLLKEYEERFPDTLRVVRGDSGFASPDMYETCEELDTRYVIRLKENSILRENAALWEDELYSNTRNNQVDYAVVYGEFLYKAGSWSKERRVVFKIEKPQGSMIHKYTFIVTNMDLRPDQVIDIYCNRGKMENFIKEGKNGFDFSSVSSKAMTVNQNRLMIHGLAYNLVNWLKRLALPETMKNNLVDTLRFKIFKIACRVTHSAGYTYFKLCSHCPHREDFLTILDNIRNLHHIPLKKE